LHFLFLFSNQFLPCGSNCGDVKVTKPLNKSTENYVVQSIPYAPFPYTNSDGNELPVLYADDRYSASIDMPFDFCFFGITYNKMVVGSNGLVTFDITNASTANAYQMYSTTVSNPQTIPYAGGSQNVQTTCYYPKTAIMGAMLDIDPSISTPGKKIEWKVFGVAPCRRMVINFNNIAIFANNVNRCTSQIVLFENTGVIEVNIESKPFATSTGNSTLAIVGIQNFARDIGIAPPGRNNGVWKATNESWRFVPDGTTNLLQNVQLLNGTTNAIISTLSNTQVTYDALGNFTANFVNQCQMVDTAIYVIKSNFAACFDPMLTLTNIDTVRTIRRKKLVLAATGSTIPCGLTQGTINASTTSLPAEGPYTYSIVGGPGPQASGTFTLTAGTYQVVLSNGKPNFCNDTVSVTITPAAVYTFTTTNVNVPCAPAGAQGSITINVTPTVPINPPYVYSIDNINFVPSNVFNVSAGTYTVYVKDGTGCVLPGVPIIIINSSNPIAQATVTNANCSTLLSGTITANALPAGVYTYSLDGVTYQASNLFNVAAGMYTLYVKNASNCIGTTSVTVNTVGSLALSVIKTDATCAANGSITVGVTPSGIYEYSVDGGTTYQPSNVFSLPAGTYAIKVKSLGGCVASATSTIGTINNLVLTSVNVQPTCATNGTVTLNVTPASTYTFSSDGITFGASNIFNLPAGMYTFYAKDMAGCQQTLNVTLTQTNNINAIFTNADVLCSSGSTIGTIVVNASPVDTYTYSINGGATYVASNVFNVAPGTYPIKIKSSLGCIKDVSTTLNLTNDLVLVLSQTSAVCSNGSNGIITATALPAGGSYEYSIDAGVTYQLGNVFNVPAGNYTVRVKTNGISTCFKDEAITVTQNNDITATATIPPFNCSAGTATTTVTVNALPASGTYQYSSNGGTTYQASNVFNLMAGTYTLRVKSTGPSSCFFDVPVTVTLVNNITATTNILPITCSNGNATAAITVNVLPAGGIYQYSSDGGATYQASNIFNLAPNTYTIRVKSAGPANCFFDVPTTVALVNDITATTTIAPFLCSSGAATTAVTVNALPIGGVYQYSSNGGTTYQTSNIFNLAPGSYTIRVKSTGPASCFFDVPTNVAVTNNLTATSTVVDAICSGTGLGTVTINASPAGIYQYSKDGGTTYQASNIFSLGAGTYNFLIKSGGPASCVINLNNVTLNITNNLVPTAIATAATCSGGNNGTITASVTPAGTYQYSLNGGTTYQASNVFNVGPGTYNVTIKNANCTAITAAIVVAQTNDLTITGVATDASCSAGNDGTLTATALPTGIYQYSIDGGVTYQTSNVFNGLVTGNYTVTIKNANNCIKNSSIINVGQNNNIAATLVNTNATCSGNPDGTITVNVASGTGYEYALDGGTFVTSNVFNVGVGAHTITVKSASGCTKVFNTTIAFTDNFIFTLSDTLTKCEGSGKILDGVSNFSANTNVVWSPNVDLSATNVLAPLSNTNTSIKYYVTATYGICNRLDSVYIKVANKPIVSAGIDDTLCLGESGFLIGNITGNYSSYSWSPSTFLSSSNSFNPLVVNPTTSTTYVLTALDANSGCNFVIKDSVQIFVVQPLKTIMPDSIIIPMGIATALPLIIDTIGLVPVPGISLSSLFQYLWTPASGLNNTIDQQPLATLFAAQWFKVKVTLGNCFLNDSIYVKPYVGPAVYMPTAFVPSSGRSTNRLAIPTYVGIKTLKYFAIYDRWGKAVFLTNDMFKGWDGKVNGKDQNTQTFVVAIEAIDINGKTIKQQSTITLIQ
jgi:hypothetical protein